ncbi:hypothetical protein ATK17_2582 [Branchiibius hedensis]|uniref:Lipoprotein n=1 Tax=Branchiibius hedensis TaxID=672460 RepID=A0A2Y9BU70_9MICO|nr:hypothetical protein [Branchiibius hedensis]PWJ26420.1 hypothetical protein ATK17_2582 [Branchiibius hedensis]SSA35232.1 hypothetical protein SAMN04489750_2582 [Branchiibius hedensis]
MKRPLALASTGAILTASLILTGCTGSDNNQTTTNATSPSASSGSGTSTPTATATMPADMLNFQNKSVAQATSSSFLTSGRPATIFVSSVKASTHSSVLTFWFTAPTSGDSPLKLNVPQTWPQLVDTAGKKGYIVTTFPSFPFVGGRTPECACTPNIVVYPQPRVLTAAYPALPANLTEITLRLKGFADLKVPITR